MFNQLGLIIALFAILLAAYAYGSGFVEDPKTGIILGIVALSLIYAAKLVWHKLDKQLNERQFPEHMTNVADL